MPYNNGLCALQPYESSGNGSSKLSKVSEGPAASTTGGRKEAVWPFSCSVYRPNPRSERCSYPFSDSFKYVFSEVHGSNLEFFAASPPDWL